MYSNQQISLPMNDFYAQKCFFLAVPDICKENMNSTYCSSTAALINNLGSSVKYLMIIVSIIGIKIIAIAAVLFYKCKHQVTTAQSAQSTSTSD